MEVISVNHLSKNYGNVKALQQVSLSVEQGELFGLIGADGAGKTTLIRILCTLLVPTQGNASMCGLDVVEHYRQVRNIVGYMPGQFSLYQDLTVEENLRFFAGIFKTTIQANYHLIEDVYKMLEPFKNRKAGKLSGGMKQKLALSCALIHKPQVLILDEPTTGVDAVSRKEFWDLLKRLKREGVTILVSTPYMDEADLCDRVALIQHGRILGIGRPREFSEKYPHRLFSVVHPKAAVSLDAIRSVQGCEGAHLFGPELHFSSSLPGRNRHSLAADLGKAGLDGAIVNDIEPGIEDCFIQMMMNVDE